MYPGWRRVPVPAAKMNGGDFRPPVRVFKHELQVALAANTPFTHGKNVVAQGFGEALPPRPGKFKRFSQGIRLLDHFLLPVATLGVDPRNVRLTWPAISNFSSVFQ